MLITSFVLYTKVDAECDKLATVVGRTKLTTLLAAIDVPCRTLSAREIVAQLPFFGETQIFSLHTNW